MLKIQSILFDRDFFTTSQARAWLKRNNFKPIKKVDITKNFFRYRIRKPNFKRFRVIEFNDKIKAVVGFK